MVSLVPEIAAPPRLKRLSVSFQKKLALSSCSNPLAPMKSTEPTVPLTTSVEPMVIWPAETVGMVMTVLI